MGKQKATTDTKHDDQFQQAGTTTGTGKQSGTSYGGGITEKSGTKTGQNINTSAGGSSQTGGGTGTMTGVTTGTGTTGQTGTNTQKTGGNTGYQFRWEDRPETADIKALRDYKGDIDPTIPYQAAAAKERNEKYGGAAYGAGTPVALAQAQLRGQNQAVDQQMAQAYQQDAFRRSQDELGKLTNLAQMTAPIREMFGQTSDQTSTGTSDLTGTSTNTQNTSQNTANQSWQDMTNFANSMGIDLQSYIDQGMEANYGASEGEQEQTGTSNQSGSSSGTGQQVNTQPSNFLGNALGAGASIGSAALM